MYINLRVAALFQVEKKGAYAEVTMCVTLWTDRQPGGQMDVALAETLMGSLGWWRSHELFADSVEFKNKQLRRSLQQYHSYNKMKICHISETSHMIQRLWQMHTRVKELRRPQCWYIRKMCVQHMWSQKTDMTGRSLQLIISQSRWVPGESQSKKKKCQRASWRKNGKRRTCPLSQQFKKLWSSVQS